MLTLDTAITPRRQPSSHPWDSIRERFGDQVLVVVAHGSTAHGWANRPVSDFAATIRARQLFSDVVPAWLHGATTLDEAAHLVTDRAALVLPFMTARGYYTDTVFPRRLSRTDRTPEAPIRFLPPLGESRQLVWMVARRLRWRLGSLAPSERPVVIVVGHGTRKNRRSCVSTIQLALSLCQQLDSGDGISVRFAFMDQRPTLEQVSQRTAERNRIVIPFLMGLGPHVTEDLPQRMGLAACPASANAPRFPIVRYHGGSRKKWTWIDSPVGCYRDWPEVFLDDLSQSVDRDSKTSRRTIAYRTCPTPEENLTR